MCKLAGETLQDLIHACGKVCHNLAIEDSLTCDSCDLVNKMQLLPDIMTDLQESSARGAARVALAMCLARNPTMDLNETTYTVPEGSEPDQLLIA